MAGSPSDVVDRVERAAHRAGTADELLRLVATEMVRAIPYDGAMWWGVDPSTLLGVSPVRMERLDNGYCEVFWHSEFHDHDANLFVDLARQPVPAASLSLTTGDHLIRSARYRRFLRPQGYEDELRGVFRTGDRTWGVAALLREKGRRRFDDRDVAMFSAISGTVAEALRRHAALGTVPVSLASAPGLLLFDAAGVLISVNANARRWLRDIYGADEESDGVKPSFDRGAPDLDHAVPIVPLIARARAIAAGRDEGQARLRLRDQGGRWLLLHASVLDGQATPGAVAVVVEPAKSAEIAPIVIEAYGLTPREREVVRSIARGSSTPQIAADLFLSAHTVRDYIKSVFEKTGVKSRTELVAKLFADHYSDPFHSTLVHVDT